MNWVKNIDSIQEAVDGHEKSQETEMCWTVNQIVTPFKKLVEYYSSMSVLKVFHEINDVKVEQSKSVRI